MPVFLLNIEQIQTLLRIAKIENPKPESPLYFPTVEQDQLHPDDPRFTILIEQKLIEETGNGYRINLLFATALKACAHPEEVISLGVQKPGQTGVSFVRMGKLWCECTVNRIGAAKFYFPLTRSMLILALIDSLSGKSSELPRTGFRFTGPAQDAFVLSLALQEIREYPVPFDLAEFSEKVKRAAVAPLQAAPFLMTAGPETLEPLASSSQAVDSVLRRLAEAGHLIFENGKGRPSTASIDALGSYPEAGFAITHTERKTTGPVSQSLTAIKSGSRIIVFRLLSQERKSPCYPCYEWAEVNRSQLRSMVAALILPSETLSHMMGIAPSQKKDKKSISKATAQVASSPQTQIIDKTKGERAFCTHCGAKLRPALKFCPKCGKSI